jgi:acyl-CoA thioester hydrolase
MGYVYYGRYLEYFEESRTEMIRSLGFPYRRLEDQGIMLPVINAEVKYNAPIYYDELMNIEVLIYDMPAVKLETYYRIYTDRMDQPHALGRVILCFMKDENRKPCRAPDTFLNRLSAVANS